MVAHYLISSSVEYAISRTPRLKKEVHCVINYSFAVNQNNHQNFDPSLLSKNFWLFFMGLSKKNFFLSKKKIQNGRLKKTSFCQTVNSQYFFAKLSGMGPWVSRIDWCEGYWCGPTYMVVRLSDISSKTF